MQEIFNRKGCQMTYVEYFGHNNGKHPVVFTRTTLVHALNLTLLW